MFTKLSPYLIALLIGLLIGIDREKRGIKGQQAMGVRSFILFALLGALAGGIKQPMVSLGMLIFASGIILYSYVKTSSVSNGTDNPVGITSEIAAMSTFALGFLSHLEPFVSLALGVIILFLLNNKSLLHNFIRTHLRPNEIQSASVLLLIAVGVLPLIPNITIDPWNIFNPRRLALIIVILAGIQFGGHVLIRIFGTRMGFPLAGLIAGLASSTVVFLSYPQLAKEKPASTLIIIGAALFSITGTLILLIIIVGLVSWSLVVAISIPLAAIILLTSALAFLFSRQNQKLAAEPFKENPLNIFSAIKLGVLFTSLMFVIDLTEQYLGGYVTNIVTFLSGLFELHGVVVANANMLENNVITLDAAARSAMIAIIASMVSKIFITAFLSKGRYRKIMLPITVGLFLFSSGCLLLLEFVPITLIKFH